jgi:hypothetical protein
MKWLEKEKHGKDSILYWAWKNKIPIFVPGITDGAFGSHLWMYYQEHRDFTIDLLKDGKILAIKGLGGFHLSCDATKKQVVQLLRERKNVLQNLLL